DLSNTYSNHLTEVDALETQLFSSIDNGNTTATIDMINNWQGTGQALKTELDNVSPYLSQPALMVAYDRSDILSDQNRFDVLMANPDKLRSSSLMEYVMLNSNPLPETRISSLKTAAKQDFTVYSEIEAEIEGRRAAMTYIADRIVKSITADTTQSDYTSFRLWLSRKESFESKLAIIESLIDEGDCIQAALLLDDMEQNGNLNPVNLNVFNNFRCIKQLEMLLAIENRTWMDLDSAEIIQLELIANADFALATAEAQGILSFFYNYNYEADFDLPFAEEESFPKSKSVVESGKERHPSIRTYPNPAKSWLTFQFSKPLNHKSLLTISDLNGKVLKTIPLKEGDLKQIISTTDLPVGTHCYTIFLDNKNETGKIVVTR
ncbi:MAG TPA: T9SS type A sorting domain-containing protein, partial [Phaeodactylibacter sp.]|nr:T9SS type A sorting domain-containing protein [Phaeodactylibacter sp.]